MRSSVRDGVIQQSFEKVLRGGLIFSLCVHAPRSLCAKFLRLRAPAFTLALYVSLPPILLHLN
jgi:hypothetical protein